RHAQQPERDLDDLRMPAAERVGRRRRAPARSGTRRGLAGSLCGLTRPFCGLPRPLLGELALALLLLGDELPDLAFERREVALLPADLRLDGLRARFGVALEGQLLGLTRQERALGGLDSRLGVSHP